MPLFCKKWYKNVVAVFFSAAICAMCMSSLIVMPLFYKKYFKLKYFCIKVRCICALKTVLCAVDIPTTDKKCFKRVFDSCHSCDVGIMAVFVFQSFFSLRVCSRLKMVWMLSYSMGVRWPARVNNVLHATLLQSLRSLHKMFISGIFSISLV